MRNKHFVLVFALLLVASFASAQESDLAYVPRTAPERTADDVSIDMRDTDEPGIVDLLLPKGSYQFDLLNGSGNVVKEQVVDGNAQLDLRDLRSGTWTIRAHSPLGKHVRRFVVIGSGNMWIDARKPNRR